MREHCRDVVTSIHMALGKKLEHMLQPIQWIRNRFLQCIDEKRVEYSVRVLEVYWKYSLVGDTYLGRCLAGFNPDENGFGFGVPQPHFREGMKNIHIMESMRLYTSTMVVSLIGLAEKVLGTSSLFSCKHCVSY